MSTPAITAPTGVVPYINLATDTFTQQGYTVRKIVLDIFSKPFVEVEGKKWSCFYKLHEKIVHEFHDNFDKTQYFAEVVEIFKKTTQTLSRIGFFAELTCKTTIEGSRTSDGKTSNWSKDIESHMEGYLPSAEWEESLFSAAQAEQKEQK